MAQDNKTDAIVIRVSPELKGQLQKMADTDMRSLSDYIRIQLQKMVENIKKKK